MGWLHIDQQVQLVTVLTTELHNCSYCKAAFKTAGYEHFSVTKQRRQQGFCTCSGRSFHFHSSYLYF